MAEQEKETRRIGESELISLIDQLEKRGENKGTIEFGMNCFLDQRARERGIPIRGTFELTPLCNLDCKMCYVHLSEKQLSECGRTLLTGAQWKHIMKQAIDMGIMYALLTGGEAMLHPDFDELYLFLQSYGVQVTVNTNGLLLTEQRIEFFKKNPPTQVHVTLYGSDDETYERVTGHRVFDTVIHNIQALKDAGIALRVGITPSRYMKDGLEDAVKLAKSLGVKYGINSSLYDPREETGRNGVTHDMDIDEYIELYKGLKESEGDILEPVCEEGVPVPVGKTIKERKGFRCGGGRSSFAVVWHGRMQPCLTVTNMQVDVRNAPLKEVWKQIFAWVSEYPVPRECFGCPYEIFCTMCVARHAMGAPLGHANPMLCERAKRFFREGLTKLRSIE